MKTFQNELKYSLWNTYSEVIWTTVGADNYGKAVGIVWFPISEQIQTPVCGAIHAESRGRPR